MIRKRQYLSLLVLSGMVCILIVASAARAALIVTPTVTPMGALFRYDYTITNDPPTPGEDVALVDITVLPDDATLTNFFAPAGFQTVYDSGLGLVSFLPDFASPSLFEVGTSISGFGFDSPRRPQASTFDALTILGNTVSGLTQAPIGTVIPEPSAFHLLLAGLGVMVAFTVRKHKCFD